MTVLRASVVQSPASLFDPARCVERAGELIAEAAAGGSKLVVFPEAFVGGYPKGMDFGARVGSRTHDGREQFRRYFQGAIEVPGPHTLALGAHARDHGVHLVVGVIERAGSTLYCTVLFFGPDGALLAARRKLMPTASERLIWGFGDGSTLKVLDTPIGRLGAVVCWENYMPLLRMTMFSQGIELYCAPTADDRDTWLPSMRHIAMEGRCFVLSACQSLTRGDLPDGYPAFTDAGPEQVLMRGGSVIVGPLGAVLAGPVFDRPCILTADLDLDEIPRARFDFDVAGHYARPDVFELRVNENPQRAVVGRRSS